ncbi:MAG: SGNH/GDSL hydrolase family protein [Archangiaceae bacterium]|nr:SGNH/GDSL hydrolase family protein [Archangiaceae bacterium]
MAHPISPRAHLEHEDRVRLVVIAGLLFVACGPPPVSLPDGAVVVEDVDSGVVVIESDAGIDAGVEVDAGRIDAGTVLVDAGVVVDAGTMVPDAGTPAPDGGLVVYPFNQTHSPLTPALVDNLRRIAARASHDDDTFMKVGDSNTVNTNHLACFAGANVDLSGRTSLQPTLDAFKATRIGSTTPFDRVTLSAVVGWSASAAIAGSPSPVEQELTATNARFATVMYGTNDIQSMNLDAYGRNMFTLVDLLLARGVVPIVTSIPPRDDSMTADAQVPWYNGVTRALAQARGIPYVDLNRELLPLPNHGITTVDGLHLNVYVPSGSGRGCLLTSAGLRYGHNVRNLVTLEGLARARNAVTQRTAPDTTATLRFGSGLSTDPLVIDTLPFVDVRDTQRDGARSIASYGACSTANEGGPEVIYRLDVNRSMTIRATVISLGTSDIDIHLLRGSVAAANCLNRNDKTITMALMPGTYFLSLDTFVSAGSEKSGEYALVVMEQP